MLNTSPKSAKKQRPQRQAPSFASSTSMGGRVAHLNTINISTEQQRQPEQQRRMVHFHQASTKAGRLDCIDTYFIPQLEALHPRISSFLHSEWNSTLESLDFAPRCYGTKIKCGLEPLAYVPRSQEELQAAEMQMHINNETTVVTAGDIHRTKHGTPMIPTTVDGILNVLELCHPILTCSLIVSRSPPVT